MAAALISASSTSFLNAAALAVASEALAGKTPE
jgi:hypothetical protein